jgi:hypothetical protein
MGAGGQYTQGYPAQQPMGQFMPATPPPASQIEYSFNQQSFAPPPAASPSFGGAPFPPPADAAPQEGGNRSELDKEIEKYQQEIAEKQKKMRSGGGAWGGFPPPPPQNAGAPGIQEMPPYPDPIAGYDDPYQQAQAAPAQGIPIAQHSGAAPAPFQPEPFSPEPAAMTPFSPAPTGSMPAFSAEPMAMEPAQDGGMAPTPQNSAIFDFEAELSAKVNRNFDANEECPTDSAMFFSSVSRHGPKKPVKPPVNPVKLKNAQQPQKGFMSKLFNKNP